MIAPPAPLLASAVPLFPDAPYGARLLPLHQTRRIVTELAQLEFREVTPYYAHRTLAELHGPRGEHVVMVRPLAFDADSVAILAFHRGWPCWDRLTGEPPLVIN